IHSTASHGYQVDSALGGSINVVLNGGEILVSGGDGININYTGQQFRRVNVVGRPLVQDSEGWGINIVNDGTGSLPAGPGLIEAYLNNNVAGPATGVLAGYV